MISISREKKRNSLRNYFKVGPILTSDFYGLLTFSYAVIVCLLFEIYGWIYGEKSCAQYIYWDEFYNYQLCWL